MKLKTKIALGYFVTLIVGMSVVIILVHERHRLREIETEAAEIRQLRHDINNAHHHITKLALLGEGVIGWEEADSAYYRTFRLRTDSLLQVLKLHCTAYVHPTQIDTLRSLLTDKEEHLMRIMEAVERQSVVDSLLVNHLPEVARRATRIRTVKQKKSGVAGFFGSKKIVQIFPSAKELHELSDSLTVLLQQQASEMDAYADSLRTHLDAEQGTE